MPAGLTSPVHLFVIILVALVVLGPEKLPQAMRQAGKAIAEVRRWSSAMSVDMRDVLSLDTEPSSTEPPAPAPISNGNGTGNVSSTAVFPTRSPATRPPSIAPAEQANNTSLHPALRDGGEWGAIAPPTDGDPVPPALREGGEWSDPR